LEEEVRFDTKVGTGNQWNKGLEKTSLERGAMVRRCSNTRPFRGFYRVENPKELMEDCFLKVEGKCSSSQSCEV
jgi:hypothetical protein